MNNEVLVHCRTTELSGHVVTNVVGQHPQSVVMHDDEFKTKKNKI